MKTKVILALFATLALVSCDKIKDLFAVKIDATYKWIIPVTSSTGIALKSGAASTYTFAQTGTLSLTSDTEVAKYVDNIRSITIQTVDASVLGLTSGQVINTLSVSITGVGTVMTFTNITPATSVLTPNISSSVLDQIASKLETDHQLVATVAGSANYSPAFSLQMEIDATVKADPLK
jgi:hypothetical protein